MNWTQHIDLLVDKGVLAKIEIEWSEEYRHGYKPGWYHTRLHNRRVDKEHASALIEHAIEGMMPECVSACECPDGKWRICSMRDGCWEMNKIIFPRVWRGDGEWVMYYEVHPTFETKAEALLEWLKGQS